MSPLQMSYFLKGQYASDIFAVSVYNMTAMCIVMELHIAK